MPLCGWAIFCLLLPFYILCGILAGGMSSGILIARSAGSSGPVLFGGPALSLFKNRLIYRLLLPLDIAFGVLLNGLVIN